MLFESTMTVTATAVASHPVNLTAEERKHLGLPSEGDK